jgi:hypothetical protein
MKRGVDSLVCSAACGADLNALEIALERDLSVDVILPTDRETFRQTSVTRLHAVFNSVDV